MSLRKLASKALKIEGKKVSLNAGNGLEFLNAICEVIADEEMENTDGSPAPSLVELRLKINQIKAKKFGKGAKK